MAITAATTGKNRIFRSENPRSLFESAKNVVTSASSWQQGDLLAYDTSSHIVRVVSSTADSANFLGIADNVVSSGKLVGPYSGLTKTDASEALGDLHGPVYGVEGMMKLKSGDVFTSGLKVYLANGADTQTVSSVDPGDANHIGIYVGPTVTAGSGSEGPCLIGARYALAGLVI